MAGNLIGILGKDIEAAWAGIEYAILEGSKKTDFIELYPLEYIKRQLKERNWQCWAIDRTVFITCITVYPSGFKVLEVLYVSGKGLSEWAKTAWRTLKSYAIHNDCDEIRFEERKGWKKVGLKYEPKLNTRHQYRVNLT